MIKCIFSGSRPDIYLYYINNSTNKFTKIEMKNFNIQLDCQRVETYLSRFLLSTNCKLYKVGIEGLVTLEGFLY